jgi:hypothetical protein
MAPVSSQITKSHANRRIFTGIEFYFDRDSAVGGAPRNIPGAGTDFFDAGRLRFASSD